MFRFWKLIAIVKIPVDLYTFKPVKRDVYFKLYKSIFGQRKIDISCNDLTIQKYMYRLAAYESSIFHRYILPWRDDFIDDNEFLNKYKV